MSMIDDGMIDQGELEKKKEIAKNNLQRFFNRKSNFCKHKSGCLLNAFKGLIANFLIGYSIRTIIKILFTVLKKKKSLGEILKLLYYPDSFSFGSFMGLLFGIYKIVNCLLRHIRKREDGLNSILAGIL